MRREQLVASLDEMFGAFTLKRIVEIGVCDGAFSQVILRSSYCHLTMVDPYKEQPMDIYRDGCNVNQRFQDRRFKELKRKIGAEFPKERYSILRMFSEQAAKTIFDNSLDLVYIDGNHSYESCLLDCQLWFPKLKQTGFLAGHDYVNGSLGHGCQRPGFEVPRAVDEFVEANNLELKLMDKNDSSWWVRK